MPACYSFDWLWPQRAICGFCLQIYICPVCLLNRLQNAFEKTSEMPFSQVTMWRCPFHLLSIPTKSLKDEGLCSANMRYGIDWADIKPFIGSGNSIVNSHIDVVWLSVVAVYMYSCPLHHNFTLMLVLYLHHV